MLYLMLLMILVHTLLVIMLLGILQELRKIREWLHVSGIGASSPMLRRNDVTSKRGVSGHPFAIWVFRDGRWQLDTESVPSGFASGPPPSLPGAFDGERVKVECIR